jgi:hypothetical protein
VTTTFRTAVADLRAIHTRFDASTAAQVERQLRRLRTLPLHASAALPRYHDCLLFLRAHPANAAVLSLADGELKRIATFMRTSRKHQPAPIDRVGLPHVSWAARFSYDCVRWLLAHPHCRVAFEEFADATLDLNAVLRLTLPSLERATTDAELSNEELLDTLGVRRDRILELLMGELGQFEALPYVKDHLYDALGVMVRVTPSDSAFSTAFNRLPVGAPYFQSDRVTTVATDTLLNRALPAPRALAPAQRALTIRVIRDTMTLTNRETDPATYLDPRTLRLFDLERGLSVAIYGPLPERQLALESYMGFTAFKNGLPVSYGGAWVFGERAEFGMNIFEPYRGGESGHLMCQLLRVYRQLFGVHTFEVDAHQFGLDNEEGIETGAFWFYYRYGFRPTDRALATLARRERQRLQAKPGARSTRAMLRRLTGSSVTLHLGGRIPPTLADVTSRVTQMIRRRYGGDRVLAERDSVQRLLAAARMRRPRKPDEHAALAEIALAANAVQWASAAQARLLADIVKAKPTDVYAYQRLLTTLLRAR